MADYILFVLAIAVPVQIISYGIAVLCVVAGPVLDWLLGRG
jgi:hypothetical protein